MNTIAFLFIYHQYFIKDTGILMQDLSLWKHTTAMLVLKYFLLIKYGPSSS